MRVISRLLIIPGGILVVIALCWMYTAVQLSFARSKGVYASAEQGMLAFVEQYYGF